MQHQKRHSVTASGMAGLGSWVGLQGATAEEVAAWTVASGVVPVFQIDDDAAADIISRMIPAIQRTLESAVE